MTRALLSRVAENIFWVGRYVERAEGTARILDVSVYQALEQSDVEGSNAARRLLAVMGLPDSGTDTLWQATERLATDPNQHSSIAGALGGGRARTPGRSATSCPWSSGSTSTPPGPNCPSSGRSAGWPAPRSTSRSSRHSAPG